jgi:hypothetical protein
MSFERGVRPTAVFRVYAEDRGWKVATAEPAEDETEYTFTVSRMGRFTEPGTSGFCNLADVAPSVTRAVVEGRYHPPFTIGRSLLFCCALCGACLPDCEEPSADDAIERHRVWHDRLERLLLEARP